jgi:hypothetical protein
MARRTRVALLLALGASLCGCDPCKDADCQIICLPDEVRLGRTIELSYACTWGFANFCPLTAEPSWSSSRPDIASVEATGRVDRFATMTLRGVAVGRAVISVAGGKDDCRITVRP